MRTAFPLKVCTESKKAVLQEGNSFSRIKGCQRVQLEPSSSAQVFFFDSHPSEIKVRIDFETLIRESLFRTFFMVLAQAFALCFLYFYFWTRRTDPERELLDLTLSSQRKASVIQLLCLYGVYWLEEPIRLAGYLG